MRKAFVGLSTPIGFDYQNQATKTIADQGDSPNPILDSPFGLMILFDKIIFLSKSLCPENMRNLSFVEFLDEQGKVPNVTRQEINLLSDAVFQSHDDPKYKSIIYFEESIIGAGVLDGMGIDNHTHELQIGEYLGSANTTDVNLAIDLLYLSKLNDPTVELVTNSRLQPLQNLPFEKWSKLKLTELLVIENISNYLTPKGPYHPVIDEVRGNRYIEEFRAWVVKQKGLSSQAEVTEMKTQVERALQDAQDDIFLKHLDQKRHFKSIGEAFLGDLAGLVYPFVSTTKAVYDSGKALVLPSTKKWQGFIVGSRRQIRNFGKNT